MKDPAAPWKEYAIGRYRQGDTIRSDRYRFSEYADGDGELVGRMLYDHRSDRRENSNVAEEVGEAMNVSKLAEQLRRRKGRSEPLD